MDNSRDQFLQSTFKDKRYHLSPLHGDGSDRSYFRVEVENSRYILLEHQKGGKENDSYSLISAHLRQAGIPVPRVITYISSGFFLLEDLGDEHLFDRVRGKDSTSIESWYRKAIDVLIRMQRDATEGFRPEYCYDTPRYDSKMALEREGRYFLNAFLRGYLNMEDIPDELDKELQWLAGRIEFSKTDGFMHRDFQSKNLMVKNNCIYIIDFQGARLGPPQYDLASLVFDPYVDLDMSLRSRLLEYYLEEAGVNEKAGFQDRFSFVGIHRAMQVLGAFGFLTRVKGKYSFERYISAALRNLSYFLGLIAETRLGALRSTVDRLKTRYREIS